MLEGHRVLEYYSLQLEGTIGGLSIFTSNSDGAARLPQKPHRKGHPRMEFSIGAMSETSCYEPRVSLMSMPNEILIAIIGQLQGAT